MDIDPKARRKAFSRLLVACWTDTAACRPLKLGNQSFVSARTAQRKRKHDFGRACLSDLWVRRIERIDPSSRVPMALPVATPTCPLRSVIRALGMLIPESAAECGRYARDERAD